jgi:CRISPR-associated protein Cmr5
LGHDCIEKQKKEYKSLVSSALVDIQINGLGQTLAFWRAKGTDKEGNPDNKSAHLQLYSHISEWLKSPDSMKLKLENDDLVVWVTQSQGNEYRRATAETISFLVWLKRFAEATLS